MNNSGMNPPEVAENALSQLQAVLNNQPATPDTSMIVNLAGAIAMQSLINMSSSNPILANAAKIMMNSMVPQQEENPLLSNLQSALLLQQYTALARNTAGVALNPQLASLHLSLKRSMEQQQSSRKRSLPADPADELRNKLPFDDTGRVPMTKEDFDDCLDKILREEIGEESDEPKEDSPVNSQSSISTDEDPVKEVSSSEASDCRDPPKDLSLGEILDNWSGSKNSLTMDSSNSTFRKLGRAEGENTSQLSSPTVESVDWTTSISPAGSSPALEPDLPPLSSQMVEQIRMVAQKMKHAQGAEETISHNDQLENMPSIWRGKIVIKNSTEVAVQMHMMCGEKDYVTSALAPLGNGVLRQKSDGNGDGPALRILQRMRAEGDALYSLLHRLQVGGATCLCVPVGNSREEMKKQATILKQYFSDYFVKKGCAGIVSVDATETTPASLLYVFPPNEFTDTYMKECSPRLLSKLKNKESEDFCYLFVAIAPVATPSE